MDVKGLLTVGAYAFERCTELETITLPSTLTEISFCLFYGCTNLKTVYLSEGITVIESEIFQDCINLVELVFPKSITKLYSGTFEYFSIERIYYKGSAADWNTIEGIGELYYEGTLYFYSETEPTEEGFFWHYVDGVPTNW